MLPRFGCPRVFSPDYLIGVFSLAPVAFDRRSFLVFRSKIGLRRPPPPSFPRASTPSPARLPASSPTRRLRATWRPVMAAFRALARPSPSPAVAAPAPIGTPPPLAATTVASCTALHRPRGPSAATARLPAWAPASRFAHVGHQRRHLLGRLRHPPPSGPPHARCCIGRLGTSAVVTRPHVVCDSLRFHHRAEYPPRG